MELSELRARIDSIDKEIKTLLLDRFEVAKGVAKAKIDAGSAVIYRGDREREILDRLTSDLSLNDALLIREIYKKIMVNSRTIQYRILAENGLANIDDIEIRDADEMKPKTLICQGIEGAYSHLAAMQFADADIMFESTFKDVFTRVSGQNYGILPLDNSTQGMVSEVYDLLLLHGFYIVKSIDLPIRHVAMARHGIDKKNIHYITAHPQALSQCSKYIEKKGYETISSTNNAVAARDVASSDRDDICCLGDISNAERYALEVIDSNVSNSRDNTTRFIVVADRLIAPQKGGKVSIVFNTENSSGTLANVLNIVASYDMSLSKIESRPVASEKWEYLFYADIEGNIRDRDMQALLFELQSELPFLKVLGSYDDLEVRND